MLLLRLPRSVLPLATLLGLAALLTSSLQAQSHPTSIRLATDRDEMHSSAIEQALESRMTVDYQSTTLRDAITSWRTQLGINILVDEKYFTEAGITTELTFSLQMTNVRFESVLETIVDLSSLDYVVQADHLLITTPDGAIAKQQIRAYPVQDLVLSTTQGGERIGRPFVISIIPVGDDYHGGVFVAYDALVDSITTTVESDSWEENGGDGAIEPVPLTGCLVITNTYRIHRKIESYLKALRDTRASQGIESLPPNTHPAIELRRYERPWVGSPIPVVGEETPASP